MSETFKLIGKRKPIKYSSVKTRFATLQPFMGGAEGNETHDDIITVPGEQKENLEARFNSGVNRTDVPRMWGYPTVARRLANKRLDTSKEVKSWRRQKGEPL